MLPWPALPAAVQAALARASVVTLLGRRPCGKTSLAGRLELVAMAGFALADLDLDRLLVTTPGERGYPLNEQAEVLRLPQALAATA